MLKHQTNYKYSTSREYQKSNFDTMKPTTIKSTPVSTCNKTKKANKEREKRKSQNLNESPSQNYGNSSPSKDPGNCKYAGLGVESLHTYNEQATFEHLSDEVCTGFTEDLNYKVRQIIHEALIKATLSGRNYINSDDIDDVFECLNIEKVYGAPTVPNWLTLGENNIMYLDDTKINLIEIAEEECTAVQPGDIIAISKWHNESSGPTEAQRNYYISMCNSVIDNRKYVREMALKDLRENTKIGPFCEWFHQFGYSLLSKDITYNSLTLYALDLIEALEANPIVSQSVSEARLELLVRLILQRLLQHSAVEVLEPMCRVLAILCNRIPLHDFVKSKLKKKFYKIKTDLPFQTVHIINSLGVNGINELLLPNIDYFLKRIEENKEQQLTQEILAMYNILCCEKENTRKIDELLFETFGESLMVYWRFNNNPIYDSKKNDFKWLTIKSQLLKVRKRIYADDNILTKRFYTIDDVFPEDDKDVKQDIFNNFPIEIDETEENIFKLEDHDLISGESSPPPIKFKLVSRRPDLRRRKPVPLVDLIRKPNNQSIVIGRMNLLVPVLKQSAMFFNKQARFSYNICNYVL